VQGGALMALGFVVGIVLPLAVITGLAVREAVARGGDTNHRAQVYKSTNEREPPP